LTKSYNWKQLRHVFLDLGFTEIITEQVRFYQHPERSIATLHEGDDVDITQIEVMCDNNKLDVNEFIVLLEKDKRHEK
jgi:hypothetical protein